MPNVFDQFDQQNPFDQFDEEKPFFPSIITGEGRESELTKGLPELQSSGLLAGEDKLKTAGVIPAVLTATDPNEIAQILTTNFPNVGVTYNRGPEGDVYPVLVNNETGAATVINRPGVSALDVMQGLGLAAAYTPAGKASSILGAGVKAGLTGGAIEATQSASGGEFDPENIAMDMVFGAGGKAIENSLSALFRAIKGRPSQSADELMAFAKEQNLPLTTSDVVPPTSFSGKSTKELAEKIPFTGTGKMQANKQEAREALLETIASKYGQPSVDDVYKSFTNKRQGIKAAAAKRYQDINKQMGQEAVSTTKTVKALDAAIDRLNQKGMIKDPQTAQELLKIKQAITESPQTFETLKQNRTLFREMVKGERVNFPDTSENIINDVYKDMTENLRLEVKKRLGQKEASRWTRANQYIADEVQTLKNTRLKDILKKGEVTPEIAQDIIFSKKPSEVRALYSNLDAKGRDAARAAIISKALETAKGSPDRFLNNMQKMSKQTDVFFRGKDKQFLDGFSNYLDATRGAAKAAATMKTGESVIHPALLAGAGADIVSTGGLGTSLGLTYGLMGRVYESKPIKNIMVRLANTPKGSTEYDRLISEVSQRITALAQSQQRQE